MFQSGERRAGGYRKGEQEEKAKRKVNEKATWGRRSREVRKNARVKQLGMREEKTGKNGKSLSLFLWQMSVNSS